MKEETLIEENAAQDRNMIENPENSQNDVTDQDIHESKKNSGKWKKAAAAAGGAAFGAAAASAFANGTDLVDSITEDEQPTEETVEVVTDDATDNNTWNGSLEVSHTNFDDMSFNQAFAAARREMGPGGMFMYHGKPYGTFYKEEWDAMSDDDKSDYGHQVNQAINDYNSEPEVVQADENSDYVVVEDNDDDVVAVADENENADIVLNETAENVEEVVVSVDDDGHAAEVYVVETDSNDGDVVEVVEDDVVVIEANENETDTSVVEENPEEEMCLQDELETETYNVDDECVDYDDANTGLQ